MHSRKHLFAVAAVIVILSAVQVFAQTKAGNAPQSVPPVSFSAPVDYTTGTLPFANAVGDFNNDGKLDVATVNYNSNNVSVLLGNGDGTFQAQTLYTVGTEPSAITVGDFNNDGWLDIAVADEIGKTIAVLINKGDGTGTFKTAVLYPAGQAPRGIVAGSLRNNGILDLVVANNLGGDVSVFLGKGDGTFEPGVNYAADVNPKSVAVGDFSGNGILDIACANHNTNDVSILMGNGDGTFQAPVDYAVGIDPRHVVVYDFNKDGNLDLATANGGESTVSILYGNGNGTFQPQVKYQASSSPRWLAVADYNNDGVLDIATSNYDAKNISVLLGTGSSVAGQAFLAPQNYTVGPNPTGLVAGAFTPSGLPDIAVTVGGLPTAPNTYMGVLLSIPTRFSPTSLTFASQSIDTTSAPQTITLTNFAPDAITIPSNGISITGTDESDFAQTNTCGSSLAANSSCTISVTFTPSTTGTLTAAVTLNDNGGGGAQSVALTGTGAAGGVNLTIAPASLTFGTQLLATSSPSQPVTLSNPNSTAVTISSIGFTGTDPKDFTETTTCGTTLAANSSCTINVAFKPTSINTRTANLSVTDSAGNSPQTVALKGVATAVKLTPASLTFAAQTVGTTSSPQTITFSNVSGSGTITVSKVAITGTDASSFAETNNCTSVGPKGTCTINVTFTPTTAGTLTGSLTITDTGGGSPQSVPLSGTGQ
ncbi:MAG TPA: FG-GAP-like repeat-containing protein [Verrucomicrobiae bacterium]|nr:FG-GAP-like repeat-containing protein [Verrucomicrobiae bacterium]